MTNQTLHTMTEVTAPVQTEGRRKDISSQLLLDCHYASNQAGETIDGLVDRLTEATGIVLRTAEERKSFIAVLNVRRSNLKKKLEGEFQAERSDLEKALADCGAGTDETANGVRERIRELNKAESALVSVLELARRGRTGDKPGVSLRSMMTNAILKAKTPADSATNVEV